MLVNVVRTWDSSPHPLGLIMDLCEDGTVVGSVLGGIEDDLIARHSLGGSLQTKRIVLAFLVTRRALHLADSALTLVKSQQSSAVNINDMMLEVTFGPSYSMLLIGAGKLAEHLATMALFSGFVVTIFDPRIEYTRSWSVPSVTLVADMPDDAVIAFRPDKRSCIIALNHDPKLDDMALLEALSSDVLYVGAIGSRSNQPTRR